ncbi:MAG: NAD-dependent epimerase/dehydratase family protein [Phycisphaerae bacterium]
MDLSGKTILVTGAAGFLGRHVLSRLREVLGGASRIAAVDLRAPQGTAVGANDSWIACDLADESAAAGVVAELAPGAIIHLAGLTTGSDAQAFERANVRACVNLITAAAKLPRRPRVLVMGSAAQYGLSAADDRPADESHPLRGVTPYALSKTRQERRALEMGRELGVPVVCTRLFNTIGPGQPPSLVPAAFLYQVADVLAGKAPVVTVGNTSSRRDFIDARDIAAAIVGLTLAPGTVPPSGTVPPFGTVPSCSSREKSWGQSQTAGQSPVDGEVFNIASGQAVSIADVLDECVRLGGGPERIPVRQDPARMKAVDVPVITGDASKLRRAIGWSPRIPWRQSLANMWEEILRDR